MPKHVCIDNPNEGVESDDSFERSSGGGSTERVVVKKAMLQRKIGISFNTIVIVNV
jgi:hypothetical protein